MNITELVEKLIPECDYHGFAAFEANEPDVYFIENNSDGILYFPIELRFLENGNVIEIGEHWKTVYLTVDEFAESFKEFIKK